MSSKTRWEPSKWTTETEKNESLTALPGYLWSAKLITDNKSYISEAEAALVCNSYMSCVVWPSGCVRAAPPVHRAGALTVSCPCPLCCEPGTPANVNMSGYNSEVRMENTHSKTAAKILCQYLATLYFTAPMVSYIWKWHVTVNLQEVSWKGLCH